MSYLIHTTTQGERWDTLAYKYYGNPARYLPIIEVNKALPISESLPGGVRVFIPVLNTITVSDERLPPWKR